MRFLPLVLLLAILLAPLAAAADDAITHAGWDLRPVFGHGGDFAYCLIDRADTGGKKLTVALDPQNEINLGFTIPGAGLKPGARYDMVVAFAGGWKRTVRGAALDPDTILLQLGAEPGWPQALMANVGLTLQGIKGGPQVPFALPLMKSAFDALRGCIARNKGRIDKKAATAMPVPLEALLVEAGLGAAAPLDMSHIPAAHRPADYAWKIGGVIGGVREQAVPPGVPLATLIAMHLGILKTKCGGAFTSSTAHEERVAGGKLDTAEAECRRAGQPVFLAILYYLSAAHAHFTVFTHEAPLPARSQALADRDALARVFRAAPAHDDAGMQAQKP